ncbi:MAG TPA: hypothetical protein VMX94_03175 [Armatimonadota bacterium]|nr:hypothetical protein [Armatimonadota bacterium]
MRIRALAIPVVHLIVSLVLGTFMPCSADPSADRYVSSVREFADNVLEHGRDKYGPKQTPFFVDGLNVDTLEPGIWKKDGEEWILSNLASQQNLFRTLDALTNLTGERKYKGSAVRAVRYAFDTLRSPNGLLYWGGHYAYDAAGDRLVREQDRHELKRHYPYYELMWEVQPEITKRYMEAFWRAHVLDWSNLDMNRHGEYDADTAIPWPERYVGGKVFFVSQHGRSFINTGSDLFYAGAMLHKLTGERLPLVWAERLAHRYVDTRDPKTGLGGYLYSHREHDQVEGQFGGIERLKGHLLLDGTLLPTGRARTRFGVAGIIQLKLGEMLGNEGSRFRQWALEDLRAYGRNAYDPADNTFTAMLTDGTRLSRADMVRGGYYGDAGSGALDPRQADGLFFWAYSLASRLTGDPYAWEMARSISRGEALGDIGGTPKGDPKLNIDTDRSDPQDLLGCLELYRQTGNADFLDLAKRIGDNILKYRFHNGFFVRDERHLYARFDSIEPLALLTLAALIRGEPDAVPDVWPGESYFQCPFDGIGRTTDLSVIYSRLRE